MRGESARRAVTRGEDLLTGRDRVDGDRYQVDTVGGRGGFAERGERGGVFGRKWWRVWPLQVSLAAIGCCRAVWWPVLAAAGLSGGNWLLQGRCTSPSFNGAASSCLQAYCFLLPWFQTRTGIIQKLQFSICICYIGAADAGWH